jgi:hypothetical protein
VLSGDSKYRYILSREWAPEGTTVTFIGLNPSTADAVNDDPTIRRCVGFAKTWGAARLLMVNLFAFRSTDPSQLKVVRNPVGDENDRCLYQAVAESHLVIAAWGADGRLYDRGTDILKRYSGRLHVLGLTKAGLPRHPLYLPKSAQPVLFKPTGESK